MGEEANLKNANYIMFIPTIGISWESCGGKVGMYLMSHPINFMLVW